MALRVQLPSLEVRAKPEISAGRSPICLNNPPDTLYGHPVFSEAGMRCFILDDDHQPVETDLTAYCMWSSRHGTLADTRLSESVREVFVNHPSSIKSPK
ncbi:hypothetical protein [Burkholderia gladioli]|uniref:hypothetical protein n=1 Tax=Burkholderia gladioli TaxID=28095 RepID=UPI00163EE812|nr:hypothetical protein [Burkholderia gladioli]